MKQRGAGFQKPASQPEAKLVRLAVVSTEGLTSTCSCGWAKQHRRERVREDAVDRHLNKRHAGRGIRL